MKKLLHFIFVFLIIATTGSYAQNTFAPVGAEWWYYSAHGFGNDGFFSLIHARATHDTLRDGKLCQVIEQERITKTASGTIIYPSYTVPSRSLYIYDNQDTVFIYNTLFGKFTPLYIYNVSVGQTLCLPAIPDLDGAVSVYTPVQYGDSTFCMVIDSIATVLYDTSYLKTIYTHSLSSFNGDIPPGVKLIANWSFGTHNAIGIYAQNIGGVRGGILPKTQYNALVDQADPTGSVRLNCYQDNSRYIKVTGDACDYLPATTSILSLSKLSAGISVNPNPSNNILTLSATKSLQETIGIQMTDLSGRVLKTLSFPKGQSIIDLDVRLLHNGIYFLRFFSENKSFYRKVLIQHQY